MPQILKYRMESGVPLENESFQEKQYVNPRPAGVFGQVHAARGGGADSAPPCLTRERVAGARRARRQSQASNEKS